MLNGAHGVTRPALKLLEVGCDRFQIAFFTSSTAAGFSSDETSPGSFPKYAARMMRRITFAFRVFGRSRTNFTARGASGLPSSWMMRAVSSWRSDSRFEDENEDATPLEASERSADDDDDGFSTQKQTSASPFNSSGTPIAAASLTARWPTSTDSTSAGPTRLPAILMVSSDRPRIYHNPSPSTAAQSPCTQRSG